jgi:phosphoribosylanthranilate isomerase
MTTPRVKVCCITTAAEARLAIEAGAAALGLVSAMPSGPGVIADELIAEIAALVPPPIATFLLTCRTDPDAIVAQARVCRVGTLQLVDAVPAGTYQVLRRALPGIKLVQVLHVADDDVVEEARALVGQVDAILLDSGNPGLPVKQLGGTGRVHDWTTSRRVVEAVPMPVFLAGGLNAANIHEAFTRVRPFGVDLCTGVRSDGHLDGPKLRAFIAALSRVA